VVLNFSFCQIEQSLLASYFIVMTPDFQVKIVDQNFENLNEFINQSPWGDILQFSQWADTKAQEGWQSLKVAVFRESTIVLAAQILYKKASVLGNYAYIPHGPVFHTAQDLEEALPYFIDFIKKISPKYNFFTLEVEPKIGHLVDNSDSNINPNLHHFYDASVLEIFKKHGFGVTGRNMQPQHKLYYDLSQNEEQLLAHCQKSTRYNIRLAAKKGVIVREYTPDSPEINDKLKQFYDLLLETQKRAGGYPIRPLKSFIKMFESFKGTQNLSLFEASFNNQTIAINISQRTNWWSSSFYAASNRLYPEVKAMYLLRWHSILAAKNFGSKSYDFWGIVPNSGQHSGYSDHKLSFGGLRIDTFGLLVLPLNPMKSFIWNNGIYWRTKTKDSLRKIVWKLKSH
jgi:lipid II:glycine glycyltransferase (peptidoglycan interpeptide bridge formation enzyme)